MGKLVVFLKDATPVEVPLDKERVTIGRRPDNDVCLPHPAVSAEHAAVVTILADSFLEDLGSTNGTLVNGKPVAKHFLRDRDQIDIGRQLIVYLADPAAAAAGVDPFELADRRDLVQPVAARVEPRIATPIGAALDGPSADLEAELDRIGAPRATDATPPAVRSAAAADPLPAPVRESAAAGDARVASEPQAAVAEAARTSDPAAIERAAGPSRAPEASGPAARSPARGGRTPAPLPERGWVEVLSGPQAGRSVAMTGEELVIGRVGIQVAALVLRGESVVLVPREGPPPTLADDTAVPADGVPLDPIAAFVVAGVPLAWRAAG